MPRVHVTASLTDAHDGISRLLGDIARFGYQLVGMTLWEGRKVSMCFDTGAIDLASLQDRLSRHSVVLDLDATIKPRIPTAAISED